MSVSRPLTAALISTVTTYLVATGSTTGRIHRGAPCLISVRISSTRHAVIRGPSLIGLGYRPDLTPAHQVDLPTGRGPDGAMIAERRTKPISGEPFVIRIVRSSLRAIQHGALVDDFGMRETEFGFC